MRLSVPSSRGGGQWHMCPPTVLLQACEQPPFWSLHSSISKHTQAGTGNGNLSLRGMKIRYLSPSSAFPCSCVNTAEEHDDADAQKGEEQSNWPTQVWPSMWSWYPALQEHWNDPWVLTQTCSQVPLSARHSSTSGGGRRWGHRQVIS